MASYFSSIFSYLFGKKQDVDNDDEREDFLAEQLMHLDIGNQRCSNDFSEVEAIPKAANCFQKKGIVTYMGDNYILIDGSIYFSLVSCNIQLMLNDKITYLGYRDANEAIVVVRILQNDGIHWDDEKLDEDVEEESYNIIEHVVIGEVERRDGRWVYIKDSDIGFNLDNVTAPLVPIKGDWLELKCEVQWDENKPHDIATEQVLKVLSIKPLRSKIKEVTVTEWSGENGTCDHQIYFNKQSIQDGGIPEVGSKVYVEAIESNQGLYVWRAIRLIVVEQNSSPKTIMKEEGIDFSLENEFNISVTHPIKFNNVDINKTDTINLTIANNSDKFYFINKWVLLSSKRDSQVQINPVLSRPIKIYPSQNYTFTITCIPKFLGYTKEPLIIMFRGFQIKRFIEINIVNGIKQNKNQTSNNFKSENEKIENMRRICNSTNSFIPGVKTIKPASFIPVRIGQFNIPQKIWSVILGDSQKTINTSKYEVNLNRIENHFPCLLQPLSVNNYIDKWHTLLYMEEIQININLREYDIPKAFLIRQQEYLGLEVKGLLEKRPSLIQGDRAIVKDTWNKETSKYEGYIHQVKGNMVLMKFHQKFHESYTGSDVSIEFHFNRITYRRSHQAINLAISNLGVDVLFPSRILSRPPQLSQDALEKIEWFNKSLNPEQKVAITNILLGECRPLPYCIYGPPGTGKTMTVIEGILQIINLLPDSRILVATPSNSAANLITERLLQYNNVISGSLVRLLAVHLVESDTIPDIIKPFCATLDITREKTTKSRHVVENGMNLNCRTSFIGRHRITIGTCYTIGTLAQMGLPKGHFTHVIIDEAGQATEPEIMIPMTFTDKENGQIILAGDPMQLGPVIISRYCKEFGMGESYLSRILETFPYQKDYDAYKSGFNNKLVTRLLENYRSLKEILTLSSEMFYDASLVEKIDRTQPWITEILDVVSDICDTNEESAAGIYVYGIRGCNTRAEDSPSWYNPQEASMVALTACKLFKKNIKASDIGVITPYIAQIKYIRNLFDAMGLPQTKIGTVEEFQGQERPIIFISTVRSSEVHLYADQTSTLGFVKNPKRLNVAITRAQCATFVFCDPYLLLKDPLWQRVVNYAVENDKYMGCNLPYAREYSDVQ